MVNQESNTAWLHRPALDLLTNEADTNAPFETGGVLMGYFKQPGNIPVILLASEPGSNSIHLKRSYQPDYEYDEAFIACVYKKSNRQITYLGDWHSHPAPSDIMSRQDKRALRRISTYKPARVNQPIMLIMSYSGHWSTTIWQGKMCKKRVFGSQLSIFKQTVHVFD
jgi:integrative and conjugative element protein (TIGR02256 family)